MKMNVCTLVKALINSQHGWAVAEQFEDTFNGDNFEDQNHNALDYIRTAIREVLESELLSDDAYDELDDYAGQLEDYFASSFFAK